VDEPAGGACWSVAFTLERNKNSCERGLEVHQISLLSPRAKGEYSVAISYRAECVIAQRFYFQPISQSDRRIDAFCYASQYGRPQLRSSCPTRQSM
jgi:hypothetical protein